MSPVIDDASVAPLMVMVTTWAVPSTVCTVKVSVSDWLSFSAWTVGLLLLRL